MDDNKLNQEKDNQNINEDEYIDSEEIEEIENDNLDPVQSELIELDVEYTNNEALMEKLENEIMGNEDVEDYPYDDKMLEYNNIKARQKEILKRKKEIKKANKTDTDKISPWIIGYGAIQFLVCFPFLSYEIWTWLFSKLFDLFNGWFDLKYWNETWLDVLIYALILLFPVLDFILSLVIYKTLVKADYNKKAFRVVWIGQTVLTIGLIIFLVINLNR